jgi:hypothetical protein
MSDIRCYARELALRSRSAAGQSRRDRKEFNDAFKAALLSAIEGTGLEGRHLDADDPDTGRMPWLQRAGADGNAGYWIACGPAEQPGLHAGVWPTDLRATYVWATDPGGPRRWDALSEVPIDLRLSGPAARDPRILAAVTVTAVLDHQRELTRRDNMTPTGPSSVGKGLPLDQSLAVQAHALRVTADLIERTGAPGLYLVIHDVDACSYEISIQVPEYLGTPAERTATVARLAAAVGGTATRDKRRPGRTTDWIRAAGRIDGHSVRIFTAVGLFEQAAGGAGQSLDELTDGGAEAGS